MASFKRGTVVELENMIMVASLTTRFGIECGDKGKVTRGFKGGWLRVKFDKYDKGVAVRADNLRILDPREVQNWSQQLQEKRNYATFWETVLQQLPEKNVDVTMKTSASAPTLAVYKPQSDLIHQFGALDLSGTPTNSKVAWYDAPRRLRSDGAAGW